MAFTGNVKLIKSWSIHWSQNPFQPGPAFTIGGDCNTVYHQRGSCSLCGSGREFEILGIFITNDSLSLRTFSSARYHLIDCIKTRAGWCLLPRCQIPNVWEVVQLLVYMLLCLAVLCSGRVRTVSHTPLFSSQHSALYVAWNRFSAVC